MSWSPYFGPTWRTIAWDVFWLAWCSACVATVSGTLQIVNAVGVGLWLSFLLVDARSLADRRRNRWTCCR